MQNVLISLRRWVLTIRVTFTQYKGIEALAEAVKKLRADILQILHSSAQETRTLMQTSTNSSATAVDFASLVSSSMVEMQQSTRTSICVPKRSTWLVPGYTHLRDYATTFDFLKRAKAIGLPMSDLDHRQIPLEQINEAHQTNLAMTGLKIAIINK